MKENNKKGKVFLIGAGPGDEGLLTLRGAEYLRICDVVVYDYLSNKNLLKMARTEAELIYVGKQASAHTFSQVAINQLLIEKANEGKKVARFKGGDPFVFGRGGEEAIALKNAGIEFEVVPGITAGIAALAYAGIPLTHRGVATSAGFITGHEMAGKDTSDINWEKISGLDTIVFYMGVKNLPTIVEKLKTAGRSGDTPAALVHWGTTNQQMTVTGTLNNIVYEVNKKEINPPALIIVGDVVKLRSQLQWFETKPLFGKKIVVTRSRAQASALSEKLRHHGAEVIEMPTIDICPLTDQNLMDSEIRKLGKYNWMVFTSINSVDIFMERLFKSEQDVRAISHLKFAAIGKETAKRLSTYGIIADLIPDRFTSIGVVEEFGKIQPAIKGKHFLIPGSLIARDVIPEGLKELGAHVTTVVIYENRTPEYSADTIDEIFRKNPDLVTFTSSSTVNNLAAILKNTGQEKYIKTIKGASIGPITSETAAEQGVKIILEAEEHTISCLVHTILKTMSGA
ncbi:MAG: uroporphyrinogen-III C-methyltransferase [Spirochaetales bacterium]|nr:uroporphyrinogen-III C-methyltransferase [Spirochaetales bacterium]